MHVVTIKMPVEAEDECGVAFREIELPIVPRRGDVVWIDAMEAQHVHAVLISPDSIDVWMETDVSDEPCIDVAESYESLGYEFEYVGLRRAGESLRPDFYDVLPRLTCDQSLNLEHGSSS